LINKEKSAKHSLVDFSTPSITLLMLQKRKKLPRSVFVANAGLAALEMSHS
jgi:hypothetical protein